MHSGEKAGMALPLDICPGKAVPTNIDCQARRRDSVSWELAKQQVGWSEKDLDMENRLLGV